MSDRSTEVFRFAVVRPPERVPVAGRPVLRVAAVHDEESAVEMARAVDLELEDVEPSNTVAIDKVFSDLDPRVALSALLRFGRSAQAINTTARRAMVAADLFVDPLGHDPMLLDLSEDRLPDGAPDSILNRRRSFFGPVGVGDLMIVEQRLESYSLGEIAHIENVMPGELRERDHAVISEVDLFTETETETTDFSEQHLESSDRFEIKQTAQAEIESRQAVSIGVQINASLPNIEIGSTFEYSKENSKRKASETASSFARDVTEKAISRTEDRVRSLRSTRRTTTTEVRNKHSFDNSTTEDVVGIYRYVTKHYRMRLTKRAPRFFYEFIVPEPGGFLQKLMNPGAPVSDAAREIEAELRSWQAKSPSHTGIDFESESYAPLMLEYGLADIEPPPPAQLPDRLISAEIGDVDAGADGAERREIAASIDIPDGYQAKSAILTLTGAHRDASGRTDVVASMAGQTQILRDHTTVGGFADRAVLFEFVEPVVGKLSYSLLVQHDNVVAATVSVRCPAISNGRDEWKLDFYNKMIAKRGERIADLKSQLGSIQSQSEVFAQQDFSAAPDVLRVKERTEIKRLCLQLLGQEAQERSGPSDNPPLLMTGNWSNPRLDSATFDTIDLVNLETLHRLAQEVRFGEQAFEWHNVTYTLYPYFWHIRPDWEEKASINHPDPQHAEFLQAGYARVLVPVRENWESTVANFLELGASALSIEGDLTISDPLWLPLHQELREKQGASAEDFTVIDAWDADVPTNLVMLTSREEDLPQFEIPDEWDEIEVGGFT